MDTNLLLLCYEAAARARPPASRRGKASSLHRSRSSPNRVGRRIACPPGFEAGNGGAAPTRNPRALPQARVELDPSGGRLLPRTLGLTNAGNPRHPAQHSGTGGFASNGRSRAPRAEPLPSPRPRQSPPCRPNGRGAQPSRRVATAPLPAASTGSL